MGKEYFPCFSTNQKDFLMEKGFRYLLRCKHIETLRPMWIFMFDKEKRLDKALEEWKTERKNEKYFKHQVD